LRVAILQEKVEVYKCPYLCEITKQGIHIQVGEVLLRYIAEL